MPKTIGKEHINIIKNCLDKSIEKYLTKRSLMNLAIKSFDPKTGIVTGYACVFGNVDSYGDIIMPGACTKTLLENIAKIKIYYGHANYPGAMPIGKLLEAYEDNVGVFIKFQLFWDTDDISRKVYRLLQEGVLNELSIGYQIVKSDYDNMGHLLLREIKLFEVSVVDFAANSQAVITSVKSDNIDEQNNETETKVKQMMGFMENMEMQNYHMFPEMCLQSLSYVINGCFWEEGDPSEKYMTMKSAIGQFASQMFQWLENSYNAGYIKNEKVEQLTKQLIKYDTSQLTQQSQLIQQTKQYQINSEDQELNSLKSEFFDTCKKFNRSLTNGKPDSSTSSIVVADQITQQVDEKSLIEAIRNSIKKLEE